MNFARSIILSVIVAVLACPLQAEGLSRKYFQFITTKDGLTSDYIRALYRDSRGYVWAGSLSGLDRFDGSEVSHYPLPGAENEQQLHVTGLCQTGDSLVVATRNRLYLCDFQADNIREKLRMEHISCIAGSACKKGFLVGTSSGAFFIDKNFALTDTLMQGKNVCAIYESGNGAVFILSSHSLYMVEPDGLVAELLIENTTVNFSCLACLDDVLYLGSSDSGLFSFDPSTCTLSPVGKVRTKIINTLTSRDGVLYIGTNGDGLICYEPNSRSVAEYNTAAGDETQSFNSITSIFVDSCGICWAGTYSQGLAYSSDHKNSIGRYSPLENSSVRTFRILDSLTVLAGTRNGLVLLENGRSRIFSKSDYPDVIKSDITLSITPWEKDKYIVGTFGGGVYVFDRNSRLVSPFHLDGTFSERLENESVYGAAFNDGSLYLVTLGGLYVVRDRTVVEHYTAGNSELPTSQLFSYMEDFENGRLWLGTAVGLCCYSTGMRKISRIVFEGLENDGRISHIYRDSRENVWISSEKYGLMKYRTEAGDIEIVSGDTFLVPKQIYGILETSDTVRYWISTSNGIYGYNSQTNRFYNAGKDGMHSNIAFCPGSCARTGSTYWFGSEEGLFYVTDIHTPLPENPDIDITGYWIDGEYSRFDEYGNSGIRLDAGQDLKIKVTLANFNDVINYSWSYRILPADSLWNYAYDNVIPLKDLSAGHYDIHIRCSSDGVLWSEPRTLAEIEVRNPRILKLSIALFVVLIVFMSGIVGWKYRLKIFGIAARHYKRLKKRNPADASPNLTLVDLAENIRIYMDKETPYLDPGFSIKTLSDGTGIPIHLVSKVVNGIIGENFTMFANTYRVEAVKKILHSDEYSKLTMVAIAEKCGFASKSSFYRIFRQLTGMTPIQYRKHVIKQ